MDAIADTHALDVGERLGAHDEDERVDEEHCEDRVEPVPPNVKIYTRVNQSIICD